MRTPLARAALASSRFLALGLALALQATAQVVDLGQIDFPNSGAGEAQEPFIRGVLLLHSFEYSDARDEFRSAQELDPDFALAYWGEALTHSHPLWDQEDVAASRAALARLAPTAEARQAKAGTEREKRFLASLELLYGEGNRLARQRAYADALGRMWREDPADLEAGSLYALAILGTSIGSRDERIYMRAAGVGEELYRRAPEHPGVLHYLIHSYDDPVHAPLGLRQARAYDKVAPAAAHALHMPSHIYFALGMWDESAAANENAVAAADARRERKRLGIDARGWHSFLWLHYTYLQEGRIEDATALLEEAQEDTRLSGSKRTRGALARMRAAQLVDTRDWDGVAARMEIEVDDLDTPRVAADHLVRGLAALGRGEVDASKAILANMRGASPWDGIVPDGATLASCCAPASAVDALVDGPGKVAAEVMARELEGAIRLSEGEVENGLELLRSAAELEDRMGFDFGPPVVVVPAHELLGEALLEHGDAVGAVREARAALARAPRRARSLILLARVGAASDDADVLAEARAELDAIWHAADGAFVKAESASFEGSGEE